MDTEHAGTASTACSETNVQNYLLGVDCQLVWLPCTRCRMPYPPPFVKSLESIHWQIFLRNNGPLNELVAVNCRIKYLQARFLGAGTFVRSRYATFARAIMECGVCRAQGQMNREGVEKMSALSRSRIVDVGARSFNFDRPRTHRPRRCVPPAFRKMIRIRG